MAISTQIQNLNLIPGKSAPVVVHLSQGNVGNTVQFYLYDGDNPYYPTNVSIAVHGVRADSTVFGPYAVSTTSGSNLVSFNIVTAMTSVNGAAIGELVLTDSNQNQIGSANFGMLVEETPYSSSVTYEDDLSIYQRILAYVQSIPADLQSQINAEASTRGSAVTNLQSQINTEASTRGSAVTNLQNQINQIIAPSGEAPSAAEVQNARISFDGVTHPTLGEAIRTQDSCINAAIKQRVYSVIREETITNKTGVYAQHGFREFSGFSCAEYSCTPGETLLVTCSGNATYAGYYFYNGSTLVAEATYNKSFLNYEVVVPSGATILGLNKLGNSDFPIKTIMVKKPKVDDPFEFTNVYNSVTAGEGWHDLVEDDNFSGVYLNAQTYSKNGTNITGYVTKVYDVSNLSKARFSGNPYNVIAEKYDGTKTVINSLFSFPANSAEFDVTNYKKIYTGGLSANFWGDWSSNYVKLEGWKKIESNWLNKKIVWFGTSIPAGGYKGTDNPLSYPYQVGRLLGANVTNESVGDSCVHYRELNRVSATNPYGFNFHFTSAIRCLTNTIEMMQWLGNWADYYCNGGTYKNPEAWDSTIFTSGLPTSWNDSNTDEIKQFSYQNKLDKYLTDSAFPDLFVFDHGYNDRIKWADNTGTYEDQLAEYGRDNCYTFRGAMNFLIDRILAFNPWAKIILIGDYENQSEIKKHDSVYQMRVAEDYGLPIFKTWEYTGWSQVQETSNYNWVNGLLNYTETSSRTKTNLEWNLADGVHPSSDKTGRTTRILAKLMAPFIDKLG